MRQSRRTSPVMPPRRSARLAAAASNGPRDALTVLPLALPHALATRVWNAVPCDARLRYREVCRAWRDALAEPRAWAELKLTAADGLSVAVTPALLRGFAARAGGRLERLYVAYPRALQEELHAELLAVVAANAGSLRLLRIERGAELIYAMQLEPLLRAVSRQCVVEADAYAGFAMTGPLMRCEPPFQALRLRSLVVYGGGAGMPTADVAAFSAQLPAHASLRALSLWHMPLDTLAALDAVVEAALTLRLSKLELVGCLLGPASAVALSRLLRGGALRKVTLHGSGFTLLDAPAAALLAGALRSNRTLTSLQLHNVGLWHDADVSASLLGALVGHASLVEIRIRNFNPYDEGSWTVADAAGALLGALVAADAPLRVLDVHTME